MTQHNHAATRVIRVAGEVVDLASVRAERAERLEPEPEPPRPRLVSRSEAFADLRDVAALTPDEPSSINLWAPAPDAPPKASPAGAGPDAAPPHSASPTAQAAPAQPAHSKRTPVAHQDMTTRQQALSTLRDLALRPLEHGDTVVLWHEEVLLVPAPRTGGDGGPAMATPAAQPDEDLYLNLDTAPLRRSLYDK